VNSEVQAVPEGYKQTEVGVMPDDWELTIINELILRGWLDKPLDGNHGDIHPKKSDFVDFGIPFVMANNLKNGCVNLSSCSFIRKSQADKLQKGFSIAGDVLLTHKATIGNTAVVSNLFCEYIMLTPQVTYYRVLNYDKLDNFYVRHFMDGNIFQEILKSMSGGGTRSYIGITLQRQLPIVIPPRKEQTAIANALSDVDALITSLEKLIAKKRAIKTAAMQQLLTGKKRLPPFGTGKHLSGSATAGEEPVDTQNNKTTTPGYKQTELGEIPVDWEVVELGNIGQNLIGLTYSPDDVVEYGTLVLRSSNVQKNKLAFENNVFVDMELPARVIVKEGDILICVRNGSKQLIGKCALIDKETEGVAFGAFMSVYRTNFCDFIFYQFQSNIIQRQIDEIMGATINQITNKDMAVFKVPLPNDVNEQADIASVLSDMDREINALEQRLNKTQKIKQGMMQELLTGRTRLI